MSPRSHRPALALLGAFLLLTSATTSARAQTATPAAGATDPTAQAASLAKEGKALLAKGQVDAGCEKLAESVKIALKANVAAELGACREKQKRLAEAYDAYEQAAVAGAREKAAGVEKGARAKQQALEKSLAIVTLTAPAGVALALDGVTLAPEALGVPRVLSPGKHVLAATAEGKKPWNREIEANAGKREAVAVPELEPVAKVEEKPAAPAPPVAVEVEPAEDPGASAGRLVVELGFLGGVAYGRLSGFASSAVDGLPYSLPGPSGGVLVAGCGDTTTIPGAGTCTAQFNPHTGGLLGGQFFAGWAITPRFHVGARGMGGAVTPGGFFAAGGPAASFRLVGPVWLGVAGLLGFERQTSVLVSASGSVPPESVAAAGATQVDVPLGAALGNKVVVDSGLVGGGSLEVAVALFGLSRDAVVETRSPARFLGGSLLVGLWPSLVTGGRGPVLTVPAGVSYRFH